MKKVLKEYIKLLDERPDVAENLLTYYLKCSRVCVDEQMEVVKLWSTKPDVAERVFSAYGQSEFICDKVLIKLWKKGSSGARKFLLKYSEQKPLGKEVEIFLVDLLQKGSSEAGDFLLKYKHPLHADAQTKIVDLFPNSIAIMLMKGQSSYGEKTLLKLLDIWTQYPDEVSTILLEDKCQKNIFINEKVLLRILDFIETKPEDVKKIMTAYIRHKDLCYGDFSSIHARLLEYAEKGSEEVASMVRNFLRMYAKRFAIYEEWRCQKIMELFKKNPEKMYDILLAMVQKTHSESLDAELIELWQKGSKEAYNLLMAGKNIDTYSNAKIFNLWRQGVPGAYEILKAQDVDIFLGDKEQMELVNLMEQDSKEAYTLLFNHSYYPGHRFCPEVLLKLAKSKKPEADVILKGTLKRD